MRAKLYVKEFGEVDVLSGVVVSIGHDEPKKGPVWVHLQNPYAENAVSTITNSAGQTEAFVNVVVTPKEESLRRLVELGARNIWPNQQGVMASLPKALFENGAAKLVTNAKMQREDGTKASAWLLLEMTIRRAKIAAGEMGGTIDPYAPAQRFYGGL